MVEAALPQPEIVRRVRSRPVLSLGYNGTGKPDVD